MMDNIHVLIIGTNPPCPRCDLLTVRAHEVTEALGRSIEIRHAFLDSAEAAAVGQAANRRVGTPKHVSAETGIPIDWAQVDALVGERRREVGPEARAAQTWTPAMDALIDPCRKAAEAVGLFMTPVLVVNGTVKHHGSVPTAEQIMEWLVSA
jgi:hypothetical protein